MQQFAEILFSSGALGYKDCIRAGLTCKVAQTTFKDWENFIVDKDTTNIIAKYVSSPQTIKDIYRHPYKLFSTYQEVLQSIPWNEHDELIDTVFKKSIDVLDMIIDGCVLTMPNTTMYRYITIVAIFIKLCEHHFIICNRNVSPKKAILYLRVLDATSFVIEPDMLPPATSTILLILKGYSQSSDTIYIGAYGGVYRVLANGTKKYIR
jgi:hypothetical protein